MKIKRYQAKDMRDAIRRVREEQGPDAVILSTERNAEGVVLIAAVDYDEALMHQALGTLRLTATEKSAGREKATTAARAPAPGKPGAPAATSIPTKTTKAAPAQAKKAARPAPSPASAKPDGINVQSAIDSAVDRELKSIKQLLEGQVARLAWSQFDREHPVRANLLRELTAIGMATDIASEIVQQVPLHLDPERAARMPLGLLAKRLAAGENDIAASGGIMAVVGPTGVGKTTTIAKIAARHVMREGRDGVALITTDMFRIGGQDQLFHYGRLLGVPVYTANDAQELRKVLSRLQSHRLVLIDTAGMSHRDMRLNEQLAMLRDGAGRIGIQLALSTNQQSAVLDDVVTRFMHCHPDGLVLTKLDEAAELGGALSAAIRNHLPISYVADGQRVPEDLKLLRSWQLVARAVDIVRHRTRPDDTQLADRFGGIAHALA